MFALKPDICWE